MVRYPGILLRNGPARCSPGKWGQPLGFTRSRHWCQHTRWRLILRYEGPIYRPPSEADSLLIQATVGCPHNKCSFCMVYKKGPMLRIRPVADICEDIDAALERCGPGVRRFFSRRATRSPCRPQIWPPYAVIAERRSRNSGASRCTDLQRTSLKRDWMTSGF